MPRLTDAFVSLENLIAAYKKAKVDVFFEKSQPLANAFCQYENRLVKNLEKLKNELQKRTPDWFGSKEFIGDFGYIPKRLQLEPPQNSDSVHFSPSDPDDLWQYLCSSPGRAVKADFRPVSHFSVDMYVVCALWVNLVGHKFDACLGPAAKGSRVRRIWNGSNGDSPQGYHHTAPGSFEPYFHAYRDWRDNGLASIEKELAKKDHVIAITMDLKSFYHKIDPAFLIEPDFLEASGFNVKHGSLSSIELTFTKQLVQAFRVWSTQLPNYDPDSVDPCGIPVGPSASRIIANVILIDFDRLIQQQLTPVYYGRYVDDIFLVIRDPGNLKTPDHFVDYLVDRLNSRREATGPLISIDGDREALQLILPYGNRSQLIFQREKQRIFPLSGEAGADLLATIRSKIDEVSSEWRLLPDLDDLERSPAARTLTANYKSAEDADSLRKADHLSVRRLGFSLLLRNCDAIARDLPAKEWARERHAFYRFATRHVLTPLQLLDLNDYLPRLISLSVACRDFRQTEKLISRIVAVVERLQEKVAPKGVAELEWKGYRKHLGRSLINGIVASLPLDLSSEEVVNWLPFIFKPVSRISDEIDLPDPAEAKAASLAIFWSDMARSPVKELLIDLTGELPEGSPDEPFDLPEKESQRAIKIRSILQAIRFGGKETIKLPSRPFVFPTRPLNAPELSQCLPDCVENLELWSDYIRHFRGTHGKPRPEVLCRRLVSDSRVISVGMRRIDGPIRIAVTSLLVDEKSWASAAGGSPDVTKERYKRLVNLANEIVKCNRKHCRQYVVFPELSIPRRWLFGLAQHFLRANMSVIVGAEYQRRIVNGAVEVANEAKLFLTDDRLGYPSWCVRTQRKGIPAHHERQELRRAFAAGFPGVDPEVCQQRIYDHFGFSFGVLLCSELTDIEKRQKMRGAVDGVFVLSWNQDLESFASLVDSAALDVHAFMILVNNRKFGDSRIRAPFKKEWKREIIRVRGGVQDYFVVADLDIGALRRFQSAKESGGECPNESEGAFKPTPENFQIAKWRECIPGGL